MVVLALMKSKYVYATVSGIGFYFLTVCALVLMVYNNSVMFYIFDWCEKIFEITDSNDIPMYGSGLASYLSCLTTAVSQESTSFGYSLYVEYKRGIQLTNVRLAELGYEVELDGYTALNEFVNNYYLVQTDATVMNWYAILTYLKESLHIIENLVNCKQFIMFALETNEDYCNRGFKFAICYYIGEFMWLISFVFLTGVSLKMSQHIQFRTRGGGLEVTDLTEQKQSKNKKKEDVKNKIKKQQEKKK
eukprot:CAMPEP_0170560378 /NCGR_PEP_ID=MMETSP0211-20121228/48548_1 /TAXON_ID=311385 /ORGANISM="Pseudokeronopsis sp., Strain OXSARD2" /LENGTH=246 /DNA_ID=CAMNT_0010874485 /DNA_START=769 /DNA_END=1509 /DNA_ORIENTATION=-